jgi:hypothetical protein
MPALFIYVRVSSALLLRTFEHALCSLDEYLGLIAWKRLSLTLQI